MESIYCAFISCDFCIEAPTRQKVPLDVWHIGAAERFGRRKKNAFEYNYLYMTDNASDPYFYLISQFLNFPFFYKLRNIREIETQ